LGLFELSSLSHQQVNIFTDSDVLQMSEVTFKAHQQPTKGNKNSTLRSQAER
jgi:hypothetical protein